MIFFNGSYTFLRLGSWNQEQKNFQKLCLSCLRERGDHMVLNDNRNSTSSNSKTALSQDHLNGLG